MMGEHSGNQDRLFYSFNLDEHVPADHLLRDVDRFLDLADLRRHLAPFYSHRFEIICSVIGLLAKDVRNVVVFRCRWCTAPEFSTEGYVR